VANEADGAGRTAEAARRTRSGRHIYPVDLVRVLTFACVIAVHTISTVNPIDSPNWGGAAMLLHFTREAFFVLTGFVLMSRYLDRAPRAVPFWRRRFLLVGVPYVVWSLTYSAIALASNPGPARQMLITVAYNLGTGRAWFHLYFLLVSLQFYLIFPLFRRLLTATRGHHAALVLTSLVLQLGLDYWMHDPVATGAKGWYLHFAGSYLVSYQLFMVVGGVAAMHREQLDRWVRGHGGTVLAALLVTGAAAEGQYLWEMTHGGNAVWSTDVFQMIVVPWSLAVVAAFYWLGVRWSDRRDPTRGRSRYVVRASDRSFGVFLCHPVILWLCTGVGAHPLASHLPSPVATLLVYLAAVTGALAFVEMIRRTPLSLPLTGKSRTRPPAAAPAAARTRPVTRRPVPEPTGGAQS
jgi:peptidoglycan/LPS O-acetylase OafA/YrhL